jgi:hypothetical protein
MRRRDFITLLGGAATWPLAARAQGERVRVIGVLVISGAFASEIGDSSTDEVLPRRRHPFRLSATREDRDPARAQRWV